MSPERGGRTDDLVTISYKRSADFGEPSEMQGVCGADLVTIGYLRSGAASSGGPSSASPAAASCATSMRGATIR